MFYTILLEAIEYDDYYKLCNAEEAARTDVACDPKSWSMGAGFARTWETGQIVRQLNRTRIWREL